MPPSLGEDPDADRGPVHRAFAALASRATRSAGSAWAFGVALTVVLAWALTGPLFGFSDTWQLFINTGTTIVTFLMVFLLQHAQNRDTQALQLKLNELIASLEGASNRLIDIEDLTDEELARLHAYYRDLADQVERGRIKPLGALTEAQPPRTGARKPQPRTDDVLEGRHPRYRSRPRDGERGAERRGKRDGTA